MNISKLFEWLEKNQVDALWIEDPVDIFYITGLKFSTAKLLVEGDKIKLFVDGRYFAIAEKRLKPSFEVILGEKPSFSIQTKKVAFDGSTLSFSRYEALKKMEPHLEWISFAKPLKAIRAIKSGQEISLLKKAAEITWKGYLKIISLLKEGITEEELALEFEFFCRKEGASKLAFDPIIAFGENSAYPHYRSGKSKLKKDQLVLVDVGATFEEYHGDMTRTYFFGKKDPRLEKMQSQVYQAYQLAFEAAKIGVKVKVLDEIVHDYFKKEGVDSLFVHSLGHGVGLEIHEYPRLRFDGVDQEVILEKNMVFTIEPGLYLPEVGGIRYENTVVMTDQGASLLFT